MFILSDKPQSIVTLFKTSFELFLKKWSYLLPCAICAVFIQYCLNASYLFVPKLSQLIHYSLLKHLILYTVLDACVQLLIFSVTLRLVWQFMHNSGESMQLVKKIIPLMSVVLINAAILLGGSFLLFYLLFRIEWHTHISSWQEVTIQLIACLSLLYMMIRFLFATAFMIIKDQPVLKAFKASWLLTGNHTLRTGLILVGLVLLYLPFSLLYAWLLFNQYPMTELVVHCMVSCLVFMLSAVVYTASFYDLLVRTKH